MVGHREGEGNGNWERTMEPTTSSGKRSVNGIGTQYRGRGSRKGNMDWGTVHWI